MNQTEPSSDIGGSNLLVLKLSNFKILFYVSSGNDHYLGKVLVWSSLGVGNLLFDSGSPEDLEVFISSLVTDCDVVMILNYC